MRNLNSFCNRTYIFYENFRMINAGFSLVVVRAKGIIKLLQKFRWIVWQFDLYIRCRTDTIFNMLTLDFPWIVFLKIWVYLGLRIPTWKGNHTHLYFRKLVFLFKEKDSTILIEDIPDIPQFWVNFLLQICNL